jgi:hypothetical protein
MVLFWWFVSQSTAFWVILYISDSYLHGKLVVFVLAHLQPAAHFISIIIAQQVLDLFVVDLQERQLNIVDVIIILHNPT